MIDYKIQEKLKKTFIPEYYDIYAIYDAGDSYMFGIKNIKHNNDEPIDPWYMIDKKSLKINGFLPFENPKLFNSVIKNTNLVKK